MWGLPKGDLAAEGGAVRFLNLWLLQLESHCDRFEPRVAFVFQLEKKESFLFRKKNLKQLVNATPPASIHFRFLGEMLIGTTLVSRNQNTPFHTGTLGPKIKNSQYRLK